MPSRKQMRTARRAREDDLDDLLGRIREHVNADTAVVLTLDATRTVLEPYAMVGIRRARRAWARVPVGRGFAGRIASTRGPIILDEVTKDNVYNPVLRQQGVQALAGVPLIDHGRVTGVLHVGSFKPRQFSDRDIRILTDLAAELVQTISEVARTAEHTAALVLQRSLAPALPSAIPGLDVGARYVPADGDLGGDWYDIFELPEGRLGFVMGDVVGHGLHAAVVMGRLKSALRAYALVAPEPIDVLTMLDHKISRFEPGITATVIYGLTHEPYDRVDFSSAGHWPPLLSHQGQATVVDVVPNLPLGVHSNASRSTFHVHLQPGDAVCLYTDGLLELGRQESPDKALNNLMGEVASLDPLESADLNCSRIIANLLGEHTNDDDIALLLIRRTNTQP